MLQIREVKENDLKPLLNLYTQLHNNTIPPINESLEHLWKKILSDSNHHIILGIKDDMILSSCVLLIVPNLTHKQKPYALIENVITHEDHRRKGYAAQVLDYAKKIAIQNRCYKIMLMTSAKEDSTLKFYEQAGYNREDKTAFVQWLK